MQNEMRDRLSELIRTSDILCDSCGENAPSYCAEAIADHLIENGVIVPPCKVGDIVYSKYSGTNEIEYYIIDKVIHLGSDNFEFEAHLENEDGDTVDIIEFGVKEIGLTVFFAEEEAVQKLKEGIKK